MTLNLKEFGLFSTDITTLPADETMAQGMTYNRLTLVHAQWDWMLLPLLLEISALLFLVSVIIASRRKGLTRWADSILPTLFHGLDPQVSSTCASERALWVMEDASRGMRLHLETDESGTRLLPD